MVGLVIVSHGALGRELIEVAEIIVGPLEGAEAVSIGSVVDVDTAREEIGAAISRARGEEGVLVLTDMFGGTPSNLSLAFLDEDNVEVLTGVNLPMIIKYANHRKDKGLQELSSLVQEGGIKSIIIASSVLKPKVKK
ncbi:MAG: PTS sugar transporter subunit IIA [Nitrospirota bacterium]